jgi:hypothetical protein
VPSAPPLPAIADSVSPVRHGRRTRRYTYAAQYLSLQTVQTRYCGLRSGALCCSSLPQTAARQGVAGMPSVVQTDRHASSRRWKIRMRSQGCRDLLVYCNSGRCNHSTIMNVGHLPDDTRINSLGGGIVCSRCGHVGADVLPNWRAQSDTVDAEFQRLRCSQDPGS